MAYAYDSIALAEAPSWNGGTTSELNTTGVDILFVAASTEGADTPTVSDSKGNTWVALTTSASGRRVYMWYANASTGSFSVGSGHTFTVGSISYGSIAVAGFSGSKSTSPLDQQSYGSTGYSTTIQPGSVTPSEAGELIVSALMYQNGGNASISSPFTIACQHRTWNGVALAYEIQTSATSRNPTWTATTNGALLAVIGTFKPAAGGGSSASAYYAYAQQ